MFDSWIITIGVGGPVAAFMAFMLVYAVFATGLWLLRKFLGKAHLWKMPDAAFLFLFSCAVGLFGIWINYRTLPEQTFTLLTVVISAVIFVFYTFIVGVFSLESRTSDAANADVAVLLFGAPLGAVLGGLYILSGADFLPFLPLVDTFLMFVAANTPLILFGSLIGLVLLVIIQDLRTRGDSRSKPA